MSGEIWCRLLSVLLQSRVRSLGLCGPGRVGGCLPRKGSRWRCRAVRIRPCCFASSEAQAGPASAPPQLGACPRPRATWGRAAESSQWPLHPGGLTAVLVSSMKLAGGLGHTVHCSGGVLGHVSLCGRLEGDVGPAALLLSLHRAGLGSATCMPAAYRCLSRSQGWRRQIKVFLRTVQNR